MKTDNLFIPVILGTARRDRHSHHAANFVINQVKAAGIKTKLIDVRKQLINYTIPAWIDDDKAQSWRKTVAMSDALIIVSPEYNHGYPGELKLLLDRAYKEYFKKPVGICGTGGGLGGSRMVENLRTVLIELHLVPIRETVYFSQVMNIFDEKGNIKDKKVYQKAMTNFLKELLWYTQALKVARENDKTKI